MDKEKATVTMSLSDYEQLDYDLKWYKNAYSQLMQGIKSAITINFDDEDEIEIIIEDKEKLADIVADDLEE